MVEQLGVDHTTKRGGTFEQDQIICPILCAVDDRHLSCMHPVVWTVPFASWDRKEQSFGHLLKDFRQYRRSCDCAHHSLFGWMVEQPASRPNGVPRWRTGNAPKHAYATTIDGGFGNVLLWLCAVSQPSSPCSRRKQRQAMGTRHGKNMDKTRLINWV